MSSTPTLYRKLFAEFFGTFVFVLVGAGSALGAQSLGRTDPASSLLVAALANGLGLAVAVTATMGISGGVLNPAVAVGLLLAKKLRTGDLVPYIVAEVAGAVLAGVALVVSFPSSLGNPVHWGAPSLNLLNAGQGIAVEALLTFVLVFAVFLTAVDERAPKVGGLVIGLAVAVDVLVGGNLTGAAMNPARALGPMLAGSFLPDYLYIYIVGPVAGAIVAALVYRYFLQR